MTMKHNQGKTTPFCHPPGLQAIPDVARQWVLRTVMSAGRVGSRFTPQSESTDALSLSYKVRPTPYSVEFLEHLARSTVGSGMIILLPDPTEFMSGRMSRPPSPIDSLSGWEPTRPIKLSGLIRVMGFDRKLCRLWSFPWHVTGSTNIEWNRALLLICNYKNTREPLQPRCNSIWIQRN